MSHTHLLNPNMYSPTCRNVVQLHWHPHIVLAAELSLTKSRLANGGQSIMASLDDHHWNADLWKFVMLEFVKLCLK